jgi:hypothetical protein
LITGAKTAVANINTIRKILEKKYPTKLVLPPKRYIRNPNMRQRNEAVNTIEQALANAAKDSPERDVESINSGEKGRSKNRV